MLMQLQDQGKNNHLCLLVSGDILLVLVGHVPNPEPITWLPAALICLDLSQMPSWGWCWKQFLWNHMGWDKTAQTYPHMKVKG